MAEPAEPQFKLREGAVTWRQLGGETILLDLAASAYLGANPSGSVLWSALAEGATREELVERLCETFDVTEDRAGRDVDAFLRACRDRGFLAQ